MFVHEPFVEQIKYPEDARFRNISNDLFRNYNPDSYVDNRRFDPEYIKIEDECWRIHLQREADWRIIRAKVLLDFKQALETEYKPHPALDDILFNEVLNHSIGELDLKDFEYKYIKLQQKYEGVISAVLEWEINHPKSDVID